MDALERKLKAAAAALPQGKPRAEAPLRGTPRDGPPHAQQHPGWTCFDCNLQYPGTVPPRVHRGTPNCPAFARGKAAAATSESAAGAARGRPARGRMVPSLKRLLPPLLLLRMAKAVTAGTTRCS